ncbi:MAG TPA: ribosomal-processing cysteine protease Prp [Eubacterium sp.]|jgi:uncharacterized protein YsxB (DUF464 family)|nr:ribosomal-processing cysteine protease Prp [Eubacterium sp.]HBZ52928.1 ribosomal-processing cysteine protease Prp [Eubacterium sp.]
MIHIIIYEKEHNPVGMCLKGHAGFADYGKDIVCSAVSVLVFNTINSITEFTKDKIDVKQDEKKGYVDFRFKSEVSHDSKLLMKSLILGITELSTSYLNYISIEYKEV